GQGGRNPFPRSGDARLAQGLAGGALVGPVEPDEHRPDAAHASAVHRAHARVRGLGPHHAHLRDTDVIHSRQRGIALLVAIIMFALCTTVAAAITYNKAMAARRAAATFTMEQALQAGMAAEALASIALEDAGSSTVTNPDQDWAQPVGPLEI